MYTFRQSLGKLNQYKSMIKDYNRLKVLDSPSQDSYLYLVQNQVKKEQFYMYQLTEGDPYHDYFKFMKKISGPPNILTFQQQFTLNSCTYYIIQKPQPTLLKHQSLLQTRSFQLDQAMSIFSQLLQGILQIHKLGYLYLHTKPDSVKYFEGTAKLCNFGNVMRITKAEKLDQTLVNVIDERFMAPEGYLKKGVTVKMDFWMLGVTFFFMLNGEYPFGGGEGVQGEIAKRCEGGYDYQKEIEKTKNRNGKTATQEVCDFFRKVFTIDVDKRISEKDVKVFAQISKYFSEQTLSSIRQEKVEQSIIKSHINDRFFYNYLNIELQVLQFLQTNASYVFTQTNKILEQTIRMSIRYALLKLAMVKMQQITAIMESNEAAPYRIHNQYVLLKESFQKIRKIVQMQFKQVCLQLQSQTPTSKASKKILGDLYTPTIPTSFSLLKKPFRELTSKLFSSQTSKYRKNINDTTTSRLRLELLVRIVFYHLINRMFEEQQREDNLRHYIRWHQGKDIGALNSWIREEKDQRLTKFIKYISEKYL